MKIFFKRINMNYYIIIYIYKYLLLYIAFQSIVLFFWRNCALFIREYLHHYRFLYSSVMSHHLYGALQYSGELVLFTMRMIIIHIHLLRFLYLVYLTV